VAEGEGDKRAHDELGEARGHRLEAGRLARVKSVPQVTSIATCCRDLTLPHLVYEGTNQAQRIVMARQLFKD
jgi:hypothetical protein